MKLRLKIVVSAFLLLGLAACNQDYSVNTSHKHGNGTSSQTKSTNSSAPNDSAGSSSKNNQLDSQNTSKSQIPVTLTEAVDGDTIKVNYNGKEETVRYLLIDTPEEKKPGVCVQPYAIDAANRNKELLNSGNIALEFEKGKSRTDKYGRLLAYVFVNGASVQETLLKEGYARVAYIYEPPYKYLTQYKKDENIARSKKLNIWSKPGYATDRGFKGCVDSYPGSTSQNNTANLGTNGTSGSEFFANCTELRKKYPDGVSKGSPAYRLALDGDKDGIACERIKQ